MIDVQLGSSLFHGSLEKNELNISKQLPKHHPGLSFLINIFEMRTLLIPHLRTPRDDRINLRYSSTISPPPQIQYNSRPYLLQHFDLTPIIWPYE